MSSFAASSQRQARRLQVLDELTKLSGFNPMSPGGLPATVGTKSRAVSSLVGGGLGKGLGTVGTLASLPGEIISGAKTVGRRVSSMAQGLLNPFGQPGDIKSMVASRFRGRKYLAPRGMPQAPGGGFRT